MNFCTYAVSNWQLRIANRPDNESEKMTNVLRRERRIMSNARLRATSSAVKILARLVIRKLFTTSPLTAAAAVPLFVFDLPVADLPFWLPCRAVVATHATQKSFRQTNSISSLLKFVCGSYYLR